MTIILITCFSFAAGLVVGVIGCLDRPLGRRRRRGAQLMTLAEAKETAQEICDLAATLNAKVEAAYADGVHTAMLLVETNPAVLVVLRATISRNKLKA